MSLKTAIASRVAAEITGIARLNRRRAAAERRRQNRKGAHMISYFHQACDPYAHLMAQVLPALAQRYDVTITPYLVGPPEDGAAPERALLEAYARVDAARLAQRAGLGFTDPGAQPSLGALAAANGALAAALAQGRFLEAAAGIGAQLWSGALNGGEAGAAAGLIAEGEAMRAKLGHYLGATLHYEGEWYWGVDRLHYLEARLADLGARKPGAPAQPIFPPPVTPAGAGRPAGPQPLEFFLSFRSPYTWIAVARAKALADAYGLELRLRYVLPMVMRGLPVPRDKGRYIIADVAREARRLGVPFGRIADPVGRPVERGYAVLAGAMRAGRGYEFVAAFMGAVWSQGVDAGEDAGLRGIAEAAGLDWGEARGWLADESWRAVAEENRAAMFAAGLWGVPSFRYGQTATWGQDRLWVIEEAIQREVA